MTYSLDSTLNLNQIEYVLYHLNLTFRLNQRLKNQITFLSDTDKIRDADGSIIFPLSSRPLNMDRIQWIEDIPVLFPCSEESSFYAVTQDKLLFHHDLLKSAFYLLSGYQEYYSYKKDHLNRYPYTESIQYKLGIPHRPIVNYYFEIIRNGINDFYNERSVVVEKRLLFNEFGFMLTHDVDKVDFYDIHRIKLLLKQLFGLYKTKKPKASLIKSLYKSLVQYLNIKNKENPYWNFDYLREIEEREGFSSVYYFLHKDQKHVDSYYDFHEKRIKNLIRWLEKEGCEIGIHGTVKSSSDYDNSKYYLERLNSVTSKSVEGIRQHRLVYDHLVTTRIHEKLDFAYDATLGFAEHEGFRHSFCLPFKLYDFENDRMFDVWEIPLNVMDVTLFHYRNLDLNSAQSVLKGVLKEIKQFNGIFSLLWHNTFFNEDEIPGITKFYEDTLQMIQNNHPESVRGTDIVKRLTKLDTEG